LFVGGDFQRKGGPLLLECFRRHFAGRYELHLVTESKVEAEDGVFVHRSVPARTRPQIVAGSEEVRRVQTYSQAFGPLNPIENGRQMSHLMAETRPLPRCVFQGNPHEIRNRYRSGIQRIPLALYELEVPTIAAVNGPAVGAGCDLACMCDIRIASERAMFAESFVNLGIIPGDGGAWFLPRAVGMSMAAEMTFTGDSVSAQEARSCGLVSKVVPAERLMIEARDLAGRIAANPGIAVRMAKRLRRAGQSASLETLLEMSAAFQAIAHHTSEHEDAVAKFFDQAAQRRK
jgi:enoyl-CoA hydratase/carnithine racemase